MGALSLQTLGLFLVLAPACVFFLCFTSAQSTVRPEFQRGVVMDTALFVLAASLLHTVAGGLTVWGIERVSDCQFVDTIGELVSSRLPVQPREARCSLHFGLISALVYFIVLMIVAALAGFSLAWLVSINPRLHRAFFGPFHEPTRRGEATIIIADVLTDIECDGKFLM